MISRWLRRLGRELLLLVMVSGELHSDRGLWGLDHLPAPRGGRSRRSRERVGSR